MFTSTLTDDRKSIASINIQMTKTLWSGVMTPSSRGYMDEMYILNNFGITACQRCGTRLWNVSQEDMSGVVVQGMGCQACGSIAVRTRLGQQYQFFDNFSQVVRSIMPYVSRIAKDVGSFPVVVSEGYMGWRLNTIPWSSLYPFGWELIGRVIPKGRSILQKIGQELALIETFQRLQWPSLTGMHQGWFVMDINVEPIRVVRDLDWATEQNSRWPSYNTHPLAYSGINGTEVLRQIYDGIHNLPLGIGSSTEKAELLEHARALGFLRRWDKEQWQAKVVESLQPFGEPAKVLRPGKVLRVRQ